MGNIVSIARKIEKRNRLKQEIRNKGLTSLTETFNQLTSEKKILDCDGRIDADGRIYRGRVTVLEALNEYHRLRMEGFYDLKLYPAFDKDGFRNNKYISIFGRDKQQDTNEVFLR